MKKMILIFSFLGLSTAVYAQETEFQVKSVNTLSYDGRDLTINYSVGGGCQDHQTRVSVELVKKADPTDYKSRNVLEVKVFDVTPAPDYCEAMLTVNHSVNLKDLILAQVKRYGLKSYNVEVTLPPLSVPIY